VVDRIREGWPLLEGRRTDWGAGTFPEDTGRGRGGLCSIVRVAGQLTGVDCVKSSPVQDESI